MNCQNCNAANVIPAEYQKGQGSVIIRPTDKAILSLGLLLQPYICPECGFVSLYIDLRDLQQKIDNKLKKEGNGKYIVIS